MSNASSNLALPYLMPAQAQKHVTHNEALRQLDILVQLVVQEFGATTPPALPTNGHIYALGANPSGDWTGQGDTRDMPAAHAWQFIQPKNYN